jgi:hypothetical protein
VLYKITEQQVLAGAGLDAYVVCDPNDDISELLLILEVPIIFQNVNQVLDGRVSP